MYFNSDRVGTKQSAIARLEDADYDGHSLSMLQKIAGALNQKVEIKFSAIAPKSSHVVGLTSSQNPSPQKLYLDIL